MDEIKRRTYTRHLSKENDKRCKLNDEDIKMLKELNDSGKYLQKELAKLFGVHVDTIRFTLNPDRRERKNMQAARHYYKKKGETTKNE